MNLIYQPHDLGRMKQLYCYLLTDSHNQALTISEGNALKLQATVFAIGIGSYVNAVELNQAGIQISIPRYAAVLT